MNNLKVSESFERLGLDKRAVRAKDCGNYLQFMECNEDGYKKLVAANFCKDRLCPMCNWRRSGMLQAQIMQILHSVSEQQKIRFIFLTLTIENPTKENLKNSISNMFESFKRLFKYKNVDKAVIGWVRILEITRNDDKNSKNYDTYHPHFHVLIGVNPSYFKDKDYLSQKLWTELWQKALQVEYTPVVHIQTVKPKYEGQTFEAAAVETAKYTVKEKDYIYKNNKVMDSVISVLAVALKGRRLIGFGKLFKKVKAELKLKDVEDCDADLTGVKNAECNCPVCGGVLEETLYKWHIGFKNYIKY